MLERITQELVNARDSLTLRERVDAYNHLTAALKDFVGIDHPVLAPQLVLVDAVRSNDYNPNVVAPPEMKLLELSMTKDGMTMPVVAAQEGSEYEIVDGFHRTALARTSPVLRESLQGYLPIVKLNKSKEDRVTSTVRHNIARGTHQVELTSKLVGLLKKHNWTNERIGIELGMDADEILRLRQINGLAEAFADGEFSMAWVPNRDEEGEPCGT